jgi:hypothetical protein
MKREAIVHTKMKRICRRLDIPLWQGIGLLESIWHLTARETPRGDIGKLSDEDIALAIDYRGDESALIDALVASGWIDRDPVARLMIHDWHEHADDGVQMRVARAHQHFVHGHAPKLTRLPTKEKELASQFYSQFPNPCAQNDDPCARQAHGVPTASTQNSDPCTDLDLDLDLDLIKTNVHLDDARVDNPPFETTEPDASFSLNGEPKKSSAESLIAQQDLWFAEWWPVYWLHKARKPARDAFARQVRTQSRFEEVMAATGSQSPEMLAREPCKRPHGASWLNAERWTDEAIAAPLTREQRQKAECDREWAEVGKKHGTSY